MKDLFSKISFKKIGLKTGLAGIITNSFQLVPFCVYDEEGKLSKGETISAIFETEVGLNAVRKFLNDTFDFGDSSLDDSGESTSTVDKWLTCISYVLQLRAMMTDLLLIIKNYNESEYVINGEVCNDNLTKVISLISQIEDKKFLSALLTKIHMAINVQKGGVLLEQ